MKFPHFPALALLAKRFGWRRAEWTITDLIDFEYYLESDEQILREQPAARKVLAQRDRALYLENFPEDKSPPAPLFQRGEEEAKPSVDKSTTSLLRKGEEKPPFEKGGLGGFKPHTPAHRRSSLRRWLTARRNTEDPRLAPLLPGGVFASAQQLGTLALAATGFLIGIGVASALLSYDGHRPIDVSSYVLLLVLVQFVFAGFAAWAWTLRSLRHDDDMQGKAWLLMQVIRPLLTRAAQWLQRQRLGHSSADIRDRALATQGLLKSQFTIYGPVAYFPLLIPAQMFGVAFNVGAIVTTIFLEWFTDLAFGWGSANFHPETIHDLAQMIAIPWSGFFGEGVGYPTLEQITGSQIHLEQWASAAATFHPDPEHLRSWRWFLVLAVVTYGLLPRLILLGLSVLMQRLALARLTFTHGRSQALYARMLTPILDTSATVMTPGAEMPIPAPLLPHSRRSGLVGPLPTKAGEQPVVSVRPWREKPLEKSPKPPFSKGGLDAPPVAEVKPAVEPEPVREPEPPPIVAPVRPPELVIEPAPMIELKPLPPVIEPEPAVEIMPEPIVELVIEPEPTPEPEPEAIVELKPLPPVIEPEPVVEIASEPIVELAIEPEPAPAPIVELVIEPAPIVEIAPETAPEPIIELAIEPEPIVEIEPEPIVIPPTIESATVFAPDACLLLLHVDVDDVLEPEDRPRLAQLLLQLTGWQIAASATFGAGSMMTARALDILERGQWQAPPPRIAVIQDGSQPPITENLLFLRELRAAAGAQAQMLLALIGDPEDEDRLPPLRAFDYTDWQRKLDQMADPYLRLEMLAPPSDDGED